MTAANAQRVFDLVVSVLAAAMVGSAVGGAAGFGFWVLFGLLYNKVDRHD